MAQRVRMFEQAYIVGKLSVAKNMQIIRVGEEAIEPLQRNFDAAPGPRRSYVGEAR